MIQTFVSSATCRGWFSFLAGTLLLFGCNRTPDVSIQVVDNTQDKRITALLGEGVEFGFLEDDPETDGEEETGTYQWVLLQTDTPETDRITVVRPGLSSTVPHPGYWVVARSPDGEILGRGYQRIPFSNSDKAIATVYILDWCGNAENKGKVCADGSNTRTICAPDNGSFTCLDSVCGDRVWDAGGETPEACDGSDIEGSASLAEGFGCTDECELVTATCGDGVIQAPAEECDSEGESVYCDADCTFTLCGDGTTNGTAAEQCDDANTINNDSCTNACLPAACGDGIIFDGNEDCDDGNTDETDSCNSSCRFTSCGDGVIQTVLGEECDDGNTESDDDCTSSCKFNVCGDGFANTEGEEECDTGGMSAECNDNCTLPTCGDGKTNTLAGEECDDAGESQNCNSDCTISYCGDGKPNATALEGCDTGSESETCNDDCTTVVCGDGKTNTFAGEECDDSGESQNCNANCTVSFCGDSIPNATALEECDTGSESGTCNDDCTTVVCGDGKTNTFAGEECDDSGESQNCNANCTVSFCGDNIPNATALEECDTGSESDTCNDDCTTVVCGDGKTNTVAGEECDDSGESDNCNANCTVSFCGDNIPNATALEECDTGSESDTCNDDCTTVVCGDGKTNTVAGEECDDSGESMDCTADCTVSYCGDGRTNTTSGEECDAQGESDLCDEDCTQSACGDGAINESAGEVCDDEGESAVCNADCSFSVCGDGEANTASGEQCDDSGETATCNLDCTANACGDGYTNTTAGEECDDANTINTDACTDACQTAICGDGVVQVDKEACDDGNSDETDTCSSSCQATYCGDGIIQAVLNEECDDGNGSNLDDCKTNCLLNFCGDGFVNLQGNAEQCDDQNSSQNDDCLADCVLNTCGDGITKTSTEPSLYNGSLALPPLEDCDDGDLGSPNRNDGCDTCVAQEWSPTPRFVTQSSLDESPFSRVGDIQFDLSDNMYVIDSSRDQIFKVSGATDADPDGEIELLAGSISTNSRVEYYASSEVGGNILFSGDGDGDLAKYTILDDPSKLKADGLGNIYFVEEVNRTTYSGSDWFEYSSTIRQVNAEGTLSTVVQFSNSGSYSPSENGSDTYYRIKDIAVDGSGVLYVLTEIQTRTVSGCDTASGCQTNSSDNYAILSQDPNGVGQNFTGTLIYSLDYFYPLNINVSPGGTILIAGYMGVYSLELSNNPMAPTGVISTANITFDTMMSYAVTSIIGNVTWCDDTGTAPPCTPSVGDTGTNVYLTYIRNLEQDLDGHLYLGLGMESSGGLGTDSETINIYKFEKGSDNAWSLTAIKTHTWDFTYDSLPFASSSDNGFYLATADGKGVRRETNSGTEDVVSVTESSATACLQGKANALDFNRPLQSVFDSSTSSYFVLDNGERRIYRMDLTSNERYEFAGTGEECSETSVYSCGDGYQGSQLSFYYPENIAFDPTGPGYLYVADNGRIRKIQLADDDSLAAGCDSTGDGLVSSTVIGGNSCDAGCSIDNEKGEDASLSYNINMALDANQNLYFTSGSNIYKVNTTIGVGIEKTTTISMVVGCPTGATCQSDIFSNPLALYLSSPSEIAFDASGNLWITDRSNYRILRYNPTAGQIEKIAGTAASCASGDCGNDGNALTASLGEVTAMQVMSDGSVLIAENIAQSPFGSGASEPLYLSVIRRLLPNGSGGFTIQAEAGSNTDPVNGSIGDFENPSEAAFSEVQDIQEAQKDSGGNYIGDYEWLATDQKLKLIRGVTHTAPYQIQSVAGGVKWSDDCATDPIACSPTFGRPVSIQKVTQSAESEYWVLDSEAGRIRGYSEETEPYRVDNVLGYPGFNYSSCSESGCAEPASLSSQVAKYHPTLTDPLGMAYDEATESVYFTQQQESLSSYFAASSTYGSSIHCITSPLADNSSVTFFAGSANGTGYSNGAPLNTQFNKPAGMAVHWETASLGYLYIADSGNHIIRRIQLDPNAPCQSAGTDVELVAGTPGAKAFLYDDDNAATAAYLNNPKAVALSESGDIYISDTGNHRVRRVDAATGIITTVIGHTEQCSLPRAICQGIQEPHAIVFDSYGNLIASSSSNIKLVEPGDDGIVQGEDQLQTIYPYNSVSEYQCLDALALDSSCTDSACQDDTIHLLDGCTGDWVILTRGPSP